MRPQFFTVTATAGGASVSPAVIVDHYNNPTNIGIGVVVTGSALYDVQHTFDNYASVNLNTSGTWFNNETLASASTNDDTNYAFPPTAVRLSLRAAASATATMTITQAGPE